MRSPDPGERSPRTTDPAVAARRGRAEPHRSRPRVPPAALRVVRRGPPGARRRAGAARVRHRRRRTAAALAGARRAVGARGRRARRVVVDPTARPQRAGSTSTGVVPLVVAVVLLVIEVAGCTGYVDAGERSARIAADVAISRNAAVPVTFYNVSPTPVQVLISGTSVHQFELPACAGCGPDLQRAAPRCATGRRRRRDPTRPLLRLDGMTARAYCRPHDRKSNPGQRVGSGAGRAAARLRGRAAPALGLPARHDRRRRQARRRRQGHGLPALPYQRTRCS